MPQAIELPPDVEFIDFGELPGQVDELLQRAVSAYRHDKTEADSLSQQALALAPGELPTYYCLYKIHAYQGNLDCARAIAKAALQESARQAGWSADYRASEPVPSALAGSGRFAPYTLKVPAFIHLRRGEREAAAVVLDALSRLDPAGCVGWPVIADLARGLD